jgi:hypothetical protein
MLISGWGSAVLRESVSSRGSSVILEDKTHGLLGDNVTVISRHGGLLGGLHGGRHDCRWNKVGNKVERRKKTAEFGTCNGWMCVCISLRRYSRTATHSRRSSLK